MNNILLGGLPKDKSFSNIRISEVRIQDLIKKKKNEFKKINLISNTMPKLKKQNISAGVTVRVMSMSLKKEARRK